MWSGGAAGVGDCRARGLGGPGGLGAQGELLKENDSQEAPQMAHLLRRLKSQAGSWERVMGPSHLADTGSLLSPQHGASVQAEDRSRDCEASDKRSLNACCLSTRSHGTHGRVAWMSTAWCKISILGARAWPSCHPGRNRVCPAHSHPVVCDQTVGGNSWARVPSPSPRVPCFPLLHSLAGGKSRCPVEEHTAVHSSVLA